MSLTRIYVALCVCSFVAGFSTESFGQSTMQTVEIVEQSLHKLTWVAPTERENGDPLSAEEIVGYRVERKDDAGNIKESVELEGNVLELAISIIAGECNVYTAVAIALDGSPPRQEGEGEPQTLESKPTDPIRLCIIPPNPPQDFSVQ